MRRRWGLRAGPLGAVVFLVSLHAWGVAGAAEPPPFTLTLDAGRVSVTAREARLRDVLGEVGHQGGFEIHLDASLESRVSAEVVTISFRDEAVETVLQRLLGVENVLFVYSRAGLIEVRAYADRPGGAPSPRGQTGRRPADSDDEDKAEIARLRRAALAHPDPEARADALEEVAARGGETLARDTALEVLRRDVDEDVLTRALTVLSELERVPLDAIMTFARTNHGADLRVQALEILGEHGRGDSRVSALLSALSRRDPDEEVRDSAKALLEDMSEQ